MQAGNRQYRKASDIPAVIPVFPLSAALLLPGGRMPLNIFEPRYLEMVDHVIGGDRIVGMIQPSLEGSVQSDGEPELCAVGCAGRIATFAETGDGRYLISLQGICRFRIADELQVRTSFRQCRVLPFLGDLDEEKGAEDVNRPALLKVFRAYLEANNLEADWESVSRAENAVLVNALSMMSPYGTAEKQALLEAPDLKTRAEILVAITEIDLAKKNTEGEPPLQ